MNKNSEMEKTLLEKCIPKEVMVMNAIYSHSNTIPKINLKILHLCLASSKFYKDKVNLIFKLHL